MEWLLFISLMTSDGGANMHSIVFTTQSECEYSKEKILASINHGRYVSKNAICILKQKDKK